MNPTHDKHAAAARIHVNAALTDMGGDGENDPELAEILESPFVTRLYDLLEAGDSTEGDKRLVLTMAVVAGLCEHAHAANAAAGAKDSDTLLAARVLFEDFADGC